MNVTATRLAAALAVLAMGALPVSSSIANPLTGAVATMMPVSDPTVVSAADVGSLSDQLKSIAATINAVDDATGGQLKAKLADFTLAVIDKTTNLKNMRIGGEEFSPVIRRRLAAHLDDSFGKNLSDFTKGVGKGMAAGIIVGATIEFIAAQIKEHTGSLAQAEFAWLAMKSAESVAFSGGNPVSLAIGQTMLLGEVVVKDIEAVKEAWSARAGLEQAKKNTEKIGIESMYTLGMVKAAAIDNERLRKDAVADLNDAINKAITNAKYLSETEKFNLSKGFRGIWETLENYRNYGVMTYQTPLIGDVQIEPPALSSPAEGHARIEYGEINDKSRLDAIDRAGDAHLPNDPNQSSSWNGNFVLNYRWDHGSFGYGDGEFKTTNTKPAPGGDATLTYHHLGERHYQVEIGDVELDELGDYSYTVWGDWRKADPKLAQFEADYAHCSTCTSELTPWVAVQRMRPDDIQRLSGSATYRGELSSVMIGESGGSAFQQGSGSILMTANFGTDHLSGALIVRRQSDVWATATFATELERDAGGLQFNSTLSGTNISNAQNWHSQIRGEFGGPQANEAGGMWAITKTDGSQATGTFHAKKQ